MKTKKCKCDLPLLANGDCAYGCAAIKAANKESARWRRANEEHKHQTERRFTLLEASKDALAKLSPTYAAERALNSRRAKTGHATRGAGRR